jgi:hypothetical protein
LQHPLESSTVNTLALKENGSKNLWAREAPDQIGQEQDGSTHAKPETETNNDTKNLAYSLEKNRKKESAVGSLETKWPQEATRTEEHCSRAMKTGPETCTENQIGETAAQIEKSRPARAPGTGAVTWEP